MWDKKKSFSSSKKRQPPRQVYRRENNIIVLDKVNAQAHREFMGMAHYCEKDGYYNIIIDFSNVKNAYPNGMIPIISTVDLLKRKGHNIETI